MNVNKKNSLLWRPRERRFENIHFMYDAKYSRLFAELDVISH